jgi:DNA-binding NarL/FixJ family response regulator
MTTMAIRVLIVDDNELVRKTLAALIRESGFEVCGQAEDGQAAITKASELKPDLVIMDLVMPLMNGFEASREISQKLPETRIVLHTLHTMPEVELEAKKHGISRVVLKSQAHNLISVMQELVDSRPCSAIAAPASPAEAPRTLSAGASERSSPQMPSAEPKSNPSVA